MSTSTVNTILTEVGKAFLPLENALASKDNFQDFMRQLGWTVDSIPGPINNLVSSVSDLKSAIEKITGDSPSPSDFEQASNALKDLINAIEDLDSESFDSALEADNFADVFPQQLIDYLIARYLIEHQASVGYLLQLLGIISVQSVEASGNRPAYIKYEMVWSRVAEILQDPVMVFEEEFNWGQDDLRANEIFQLLSNFLNAIGISAFLRDIEDEVADALEDVEEPGDPVPMGIDIPFFDAGTPDAEADAGLIIMKIAGNGVGKTGLAMIPYAHGSVQTDFQITDYMVFNMSSDLDISGGIGIKLRPDKGLEMITGFYGSDVSSAEGSLEISIIVQKEDQEPIVLIGNESGTRLEMKTLSGTGGVIVGTNEEPDLYTELALNGGQLVISGGEGDGFLQKILPEDGIKAAFDLTLGYSSQRSVYFKGSGGLEIKVPSHIELGPIELQSVTTALKFDNGDIPVEVGASVKAELGPLVATVENMGVKAVFSFPSDGGNLGPLDLGVDFKPPNGIGLSVDAEGFKGGGYLAFDFDNERYSGILELEFQNSISLKAIGLLTTRLPDGSKGFSLLIIITAEFTPIQLGFGFTLNGVGGLLGLNRTMKVEVLREGVRTGALSSVLFPTDIVANANQIISDLRAIFPPYEDQFVFGPMGKIGWGTPTIITIDLGLIIEIPEPVRVAILGVVRAILPDEKAAIVQIQVNFLGTLEFDKKLLAFDASLFDSRLLAYTLEGDMALRMKWGDDPDFLLSVGGFHPSYDPPPLDIPKLTKITISLLGGNNPRLTLTSYKALTSNTVQFGASVELYAKAWKFSVQGFLGYDVLIQFNPFYFIAQVGAMLAVKSGSSTLFSIKLAFTLEGPTPWKAKGKATFKVLFVKVKVRFNKTFGEKKDTTLPEVKVMPRLKEALSKKDNWEGKLPARNNLLVKLRDLSESTDGLVIHPAGTLTVKQKVVPLNVKIDRVGSQKPSDASKFDLSVDDTIPASLTRNAYVKEQFAPAQYFEMSDDEKLSRKSFEKLDAGITLSNEENALKFSYFVKRELDYETIVIDNHYKRIIGLFGKLLNFFAGFLLKGNAVAKSRLSFKYHSDLEPRREKVEVSQEGYSVVKKDDLTLLDNEATRDSETEAISIMQEKIDADPDLNDKIQVVPNYEVNTL